MSDQSTIPIPERRWRFSLLTLFAVVSAVAIAIGTGPYWTLALLYLAFFASLKFSSKRLPEGVQNMQGQRVSRQVYLTSMLFVGVFGPLFPTGLVLVCMAKELTANLVMLAAWVACALLAIVLAAHWKTVSVNTPCREPESATQIREKGSEHMTALP